MRTYLEITFRAGRPLAAYLYLPRRVGDLSASTREVGPGIRADLTADGRVMGLELLAPGAVTASSVNAALQTLGLPPLAPGELAPLAA